MPTATAWAACWRPPSSASRRASASPILTAWKARWPIWPSRSRRSRASSSAPASALPDLRGSEANDAFRMTEGSRVVTGHQPQRRASTAASPTGCRWCFRTAGQAHPQHLQAAGHGGLYRQKERATLHSGPPRPLHRAPGRHCADLRRRPWRWATCSPPGTVPGGWTDPTSYRKEEL